MTITPHSRPAPGVLLIAHADPRFEAGLRMRVEARGLILERARPGPFAFEGMLREGFVGTVAHVANAHERDLLAESGVPAVAFASAPLWPELDTVIPDQQRGGVLAADHLLRRGHHQLAFVGLTDNTFSAGRETGFVQRVASCRRPCHRYQIPVRHRDGYGALRPTAAGLRELGRWLSGLPRPIGLFAANDALALAVLDAARRRGWSVPEDLAVLGMDDSASAAMAGLSTVCLPSWRWGAAAGDALLRRLTRPGKPPRITLVPPDEIRVRDSSTGLVVPDPLLETALQLIHAQGTELSLARLAAALGIGPRHLLRRFQSVCCCSPSQLLRERRLQEARLQLQSSAASLQAVAQRAGFRSRQSMDRAFAELCGTRPADYRRLRRGRRPPIEP